MQAFFGKTSHHPGLSAPLQPRFGSLRFLAFPKAKIAIEREEICECDSHPAHKLTEQRLTANWLAPWENDYSHMCSKVSSDWLPSYIKAVWTVVQILKMAGYFLDTPHIFSFFVFMYYTLAVDELVNITSTALVCTFVCSITSDFEGIQTLLFCFQKCNMGLSDMVDSHWLSAFYDWL